MSKLFAEFLESEKTGGIILVFCTVVSIITANSFLGEWYVHFWHTHVNLSFSFISLDYSIQHWINDGLMAVFFLLVGLEIERELYAGELKNFRNALLPIFAALGGMVVPAAIHFLFNHGTPAQGGIAIPMATDIAFALGVLSLLGSRVPVSVKIFLTALAIIDDLGAIVIIAIFYSKGLSLMYLGLAGGLFVFLLALNRLRFRRLSVYLVLGVFMWYCMLKSGVHATIAGVLLAFAIPFMGDDDNPSYALQHFLHRPVAYLVLPLFALANTAIVISAGNAGTLLSGNSLGIILGLLTGKPLGILLFTFLAVYLKFSDLPQDMRWRGVLGVGFLGGIGFTMSIFIANLAFTENAMIQGSILSVLMASLLAGMIGFTLSSYAFPKHAEKSG
jgi:NhaA family Na+:H+ antiporter